MGTSGSAQATADQTNAFDLKAADCEVLVDCSLSSGSFNGGFTYAYLEVTDGSNVVSLWTNTGGANNFNGTMRLVVDVSANTIYRYDSITDTTSTAVDVSSLTGSNWWLRVEVNAPEQAGSGSGSASAAIYSVGYADGTAGSKNYVSKTQTVSSTDTSFVKYYLSGIASPEVDLSFDSGSNYALLTENAAIVETVNGGTGIKIKTTVNIPETINVGSTDRNIEYVGTSDKFQLFYKNN